MKDIVNRLGDVYRGSRVLITGHTGFKGGWLVLLLRRLGAEVIGYALEPPSSPSFFQAAGLENEITHIHGDVRDLHQIKRIIEQYHPTFVFHLAAQSLVRLSYKEPHLTYETNVMGTVNVLEAIRGTESVRVGVIVTSDKCYENQEMVWGYRENDPLGGRDPYSSSKGCAELIKPSRAGTPLMTLSVNSEGPGYPALRSREPAVGEERPNGANRIDTEAPSAWAHFTSVLTPKFFTRPDSSFAT